MTVSCAERAFQMYRGLGMPQDWPLRFTAGSRIDCFDHGCSRWGDWSRGFSLSFDGCFFSERIFDHSYSWAGSGGWSVKG